MRVPALLKNDAVIVALVVAVCLMALVVTLKNVLHVPASELSRDVVLYCAFYSCFWLLPLISAKTEKRSRFDTPVLWSLVVVAVTVGIIAVNAV